MLEMKQEKERVILAGAGKIYAHEPDIFTPDPLDELRLLARTAGSEVVGTLTQGRAVTEPAYYIGKGKAYELKDLVEELQADTIIFDNDLTPVQVSNLMKLLDRKVIDRSGLILDIFALRARTREAKTQVALAQMNYLLPRLTRQWTHLSRQQGGIGTRGPGETQLEVDRRAIRKRITSLNAILEKIEKQREIGRKNRIERFKVALVGYTNAGKSTLLNRISGADVPTENLLFKTLDSTTRALHFKHTPEVLISDTVGFIRNLPHDLVASFKSTLAEVRDADLLLHVIDATHPEWNEQAQTVRAVLSDMNIAEHSMMTVFNKIDHLHEGTRLLALRQQYPEAVFISAITGDGIESLEERLTSEANHNRRQYTMDFGPHDSALLQKVYQLATIIGTESYDDTIRLTFSIPVALSDRLALDEKGQ